jgi:hypothetical protein
VVYRFVSFRTEPDLLYDRLENHAYAAPSKQKQARSIRVT